MNEFKTLTQKEVSAVLKCSKRFVTSEIKSGNLAPVIRINKRVILIRQATVLAYMQARMGRAA